MERLYNVTEVSQMLGISESCVRRWIIRRQIRFLKVGSAVRFTAEMIEEKVPGYRVTEGA